MRIYRRYFNRMIALQVIIMLISAMLSDCAKSSSDINMDVGDRIDEYVNAFNEVSTRQKINGNIIIVSKGEIIVNRSYGMADYENKIPVSQDTVFRLCSTTKFFTALGIMQLYEKGFLDLNDKVSKYVPAQKRGSEMTIHQLLTHTSGLVRDVGDLGYVSAFNYTPLGKLVSIINERDLIYDPGSKMSYSNAGYQILADIIEKVSKQPYEEYMKENIFKAAVMKNTGVDRSNSEIKNLAQGYYYSLEKFNKKPQYNMSCCFGSGNIYSTAYDIYLFDRALMNGKIVSKETLNKMASDNTGLGMKYGYGCFLGDVNGHRWFGHAGNLNSGYFSYYIRFPDEDLTVIMLFNTVWNENESIMEALSTVALGEKYRLPVKKQAISISDSELKKFEGKYEVPDGGIITVKKYENGLSVTPSSIEAFLVPCSENEFILQGYEYYEHIFELDKDGKVVYYILRNSTTELKMKKIE